MQDFNINPFDEPIITDEWRATKEERTYYEQQQAAAAEREEQKRQAAAEFMRYGEWGQPADGLTDEEFERMGKEYNAQQLQKRRNEIGSENANRLLTEHPDLMTTPANAAIFKEFMTIKGLDETNYDDIRYAYSQLKPKLVHRDLAAVQERQRVAQREAVHIARRAVANIPQESVDKLSDAQFAELGQKLGYDVPGGAW